MSKIQSTVRATVSNNGDLQLSRSAMRMLESVYGTDFNYVRLVNTNELTGKRSNYRFYFRPTTAKGRSAIALETRTDGSATLSTSRLFDSMKMQYGRYRITFEMSIRGEEGSQEVILNRVEGAEAR